MTRAWWILAALAVAALDVSLLWFHWPDVAGNLAASVIWGTPALVAQHVALLCHADRQHAETRALLGEDADQGRR
ncbi:hypothetical protein [Streptomyces sp. NPDC051994]|uniref:hypothetical protein n=1 Tax=unclassified Streptomyces TaxID=2593676 RepID=UPI00341E3780